LLFYEHRIVRLGEYDWTSEQDCYGRVCAPPYSEYMVIKIYTHPRYRSIADHDIALLKLDQSVLLTGNQLAYANTSNNFQKFLFSQRPYDPFV